MTQPKDDGGPAFPFVTPLDDVQAVTPGMTLRDAMAIGALSVAASNVSARAQFVAGAAIMPGEALPPFVAPVDADVARQAYAIADAMLEARKQ